MRGAPPRRSAFSPPQSSTSSSGAARRAAPPPPPEEHLRLLKKRSCYERHKRPGVVILCIIFIVLREIAREITKWIAFNEEEPDEIPDT